MKKKIVSALLLIASMCGFAQEQKQKIAQAFEGFLSDSQLNSALASLYVVDATTGEVVYEKNARTGMATGSTLKIVTAATAYEILGKDFRYRTQLAYDGNIANGMLYGDIWIRGEGDPTLGSWRWKQTNDTLLVNEWRTALQKKAIMSLKGRLVADDSPFESQSVPGGWIFEDIGNYYGAGASAINWKENQYDIRLRSGDRIGERIDILSTGMSGKIKFFNELTSAAKGSGDNAYVYPAGDSSIYLRGTIPVNENNFSISAAVQDPPVFLLHDFSSRCLGKSQIKFVEASRDIQFVDTSRWKVIDVHFSPTLDSMVYWFLKKSINLYGEALVKTFAFRKKGKGATETGLSLIRDFWKEKGIDLSELNLADGSGLSPLNRITTHAQVTVLLYARQQPWFRGYLNAFPEYNGMKMKSGTINGAKGFCGYQTSSNGKAYVFSFLVNNYNGSSSLLIEKMYKVLDNLK
ncbi:MAG: D-alanyl-D-alanine carboxypeptidase/D-alanyl-D-alanine-endopeptidase [Flavisolibacter sp.]